MFSTFLSVLSKSRFHKMKKPDTAKVEPMVKLNTDKIPNLEEILSEINLSHRLPNFIKMGVTDSRHLLRLKKMDYNIMVKQVRIIFICII